MDDFMLRDSSNRSNTAIRQGESMNTYDRSWEEIETMLGEAKRRQSQWREFYDLCKEQQDKDGMKDAARNHKALEGVIKTLRWVCGDTSVDNPLS